jgi:Holliday junction resolvasome RuvABC endonuclease subunit
MKNKKSKCLLALDLSMTNTGAAVFDENNYPIEVTSVSTNSKQTYGERLKTIADVLLDLKSKYDFYAVVLEGGFFRHIKSTQVIYRVHGLANYLFWDIPQYDAAPSTIKKIICGKGTGDKHEVQNKILEIFPKLEFGNEDESDAVSIGHAFIKDQEAFNKSKK